MKEKSGKINVSVTTNTTIKDGISTITLDPVQMISELYELQKRFFNIIELHMNELS